MSLSSDHLFNQPIKHRRATTGTHAARALQRATRGVSNSRRSSSEIGDSEDMAGKVASVYGPYPNGDKWRLIVISADGRRKAKVLDSYDAALHVKASVSASLASDAARPIGAVVDEFIATKQKQGLKAASLRAWGVLLAPLPRDIGVSELSASDAQALYDRWTDEYSAATHRARLRHARGLYAWAIERGYASKNPFVSIKAVGKPRRGKPQPRVDEARKLYRELFRLAWAGESPAGCLVVQILLGPRSSEVWGLRVRDVDAEGMRLHVAADGGKTVNATRTLAIEVPQLRDLLLHYCRSKQPTDYLFPRTCQDGSTSSWLYKYLHKLCVHLNIPRVCPHSLRGLHATLAVQAGATSRAVAGVLGHGSDEITRRHYIAPGADQAGNARNLAALLAPAEPIKPAAPPQSDLLAALLALPPEERRAILSAVGEKL